MRGSFRHLWATLGFIAPLGLLGWWASAELGRRGDQVLEQAGQTVATALDGPADAVGRGLLRSFAHASPTDLSLGTRSPTEAVAALQGDWVALRHLVLLGDDGGLLHPTAAPATELPLERPPTEPALVAAEAAVAMGRPEQAERYVRGFLDAHQVDSPVDLGSEVRGRFWLGSLLRKRGAARGALRAWQDAVDWVDLAEVSPGPGPSTESRYLKLLALTGIAELESKRQGAGQVAFGAATQTALSTMQGIAGGDYDTLNEAVLQSLWTRLEACLPDTEPSGAPPARESGQEPARLTLARKERARRAGRSFATRTGADIAAAARRHMRSAGRTGTWVEVVPGEEPGLVLFRPTSAMERASTEAAWVGVHVDAVLTLGPSLAPFVGANESGSTAAGIQVAVTDRDGVGFLPGASPPPRVKSTAASPEATPLVSSRELNVPGLRLIAAADPDRWLADARSSNRSEAILVLATFLAAIVGALWLWRSVSRAEELAALKVELMSRLSHELKTPLALVKMYAETLALDRAKDQEERKRFGGIIAREADRLSLLLERVLNFSRRRAGLLVYRQEPTDLSGLVARTAQAWQPHAQKAGASVALRVAEGIEHNVDPTALSSALLNLLDNAVKFTPEDRRGEAIELELDRHPDGLRLVVRDRGIGIPSKDRKRVFQGFHRGSNAQAVGGAGLGLEMVAHCCRAHGATVSARPRDGGGTCIEIHWPGTER